MKKTKLKVIIGLLFISLILSGCSKDAQAETVQENKVTTTELNNSSEKVAVQEKIYGTVKQDNTPFSYYLDSFEYTDTFLEKEDVVTILFRTEDRIELNGKKDYIYKAVNDIFGSSWVHGAYIDIEKSDKKLINPYAEPVYKKNEIIHTFKPLTENEVLVWKDINGYLWLYAQDNNAQSILRLITEWDNSGTSLNFSKDRKICIFDVYNRDHTKTSTILVNGKMGTIEFLFNTSPVTLSSDGAYVLYKSNSDNEFVLYNLIEKKEKTRFKIQLHNQSIYNTFLIKRYYNGTFNILYTEETGGVLAEATFNPVTQELKILWDETDNSNYIFESYTSERWDDPANKIGKEAEIK